MSKAERITVAVSYAGGASFTCTGELGPVLDAMHAWHVMMLDKDDLDELAAEPADATPIAIATMGNC